jgi:hypothetical protein
MAERGGRGSRQGRTTGSAPGRKTWICPGSSAVGSSPMCAHWAAFESRGSRKGRANRQEGDSGGGDWGRGADPHFGSGFERFPKSETESSRRSEDWGPRVSNPWGPEDCSPPARGGLGLPVSVVLKCLTHPRPLTSWAAACRILIRTFAKNSPSPRQMDRVEARH